MDFICDSQVTSLVSKTGRVGLDTSVACHVLNLIQPSIQMF